VSEPSYRFGPFVLDRPAYRLTRDAAVVDVTPKLLDLLFFFAGHAGALVTKDELLDAVWPDANVTENALTQAVSDLRDVLDDDPAEPRYIKTIARRGYRFIAAVEEVSEKVRLKADTTGIEDVRLKPDATRADVNDASVAVMDFANLSGDAESAWLSNGIAETVTSDLRAFGQFRIVDRRHVIDASRATDGSLHQVAGALGIRLAVVGGFQRQTDRIRITARLVDVASGDALADSKVDGRIADIFELQDQVVRQLSRQLGLEPSPARAAARDTPSLDAYRAFTEGWLRLESLDVREMPLAIAELKRAVVIDPHYALAFAGLASAELALYESTRSDNEPRRDLLEHATDHARHAVSLGLSLAEAHATLALVLVSAGQMAEAAASAQRAVALEPSNWRHLFRLGHASWGEARLRAARRTLALYPEFAFAHFQMAMVHVARHDLAAAETILRHGAAVQDRQIGRGGRYPALGLHWLLGLVRLAHDDVEEAVEEFEREEALAATYRLYGHEYTLHARYACAAARLREGRPDQSIALLDRALAMYPAHAESHVLMAVAREAAGDPEGARTAMAEAERAIVQLTTGRPADAAITRAQVLAASRRYEEATAVLQRLLISAPPGFTGWVLPVDPLLRDLVATQGFVDVLTTLAERAR
jgi:DNA-binding winged helix-turn-helix (wHTH) protein/Flp pilus assembly protein TadD